jgi:hypothetical protein
MLHPCPVGDRMLTRQREGENGYIPRALYFERANEASFEVNSYEKGIGATILLGHGHICRILQLSQKAWEWLDDRRDLLCA